MKETHEHRPKEQPGSFIGGMFAACWSALALIEATALSRALESLGLPKDHPTCLGRCESLPGARGD
jgi:hypothetical protein